MVFTHNFFHVPNEKKNLIIQSSVLTFEMPPTTPTFLFAFLISGGGLILDMNIHQKALDKFGAHEQYFKLIEEMAELTQAILHNRLLRENNIEEEIADVQILLDQIKILHPSWEIWQENKLIRLEKLICS